MEFHNFTPHNTDHSTNCVHILIHCWLLFILFYSFAQSISMDVAFFLYAVSLYGLLSLQTLHRCIILLSVNGLFTPVQSRPLGCSKMNEFIMNSNTIYGQRKKHTHTEKERERINNSGNLRTENRPNFKFNEKFMIQWKIIYIAYWQMCFYWRKKPFDFK